MNVSSRITKLSLHCGVTTSLAKLSTHDDGVPLTKIKEPEQGRTEKEGPDFPDNVSRGLKH